MATQHRPSELIALKFPSTSVPASVRESLDAALASGVVRLLDLVVASRDESGALTVTEVEDLAAEFDAAGLDVAEQGLVAEEDLAEVAEDLEPGNTVLVVLIEHVWARDLTASVFDSGGELLASERIPAWVLDEIETLETAQN